MLKHFQGLSTCRKAAPKAVQDAFDTSLRIELEKCISPLKNRYHYTGNTHKILNQNSVVLFIL